MTRRANGEGTIYRRSDGRWEAALYVPMKVDGGQTEVAVLGGGQTGVGGRSNEGRPEVKRRSLRRVHGMRPPPEHDAAADTGLGSPGAGTKNLRQTPRPPGQANPVHDLSATRIHVALTLDRLRAVGHHPISGAWPSLLLVTSSASLQLDPAKRPLSRTGDAYFRPPPDRGHPLARGHSAPCPHLAGQQGGWPHAPA